MKDDYGRRVELLCPVCGGKQFEYDETKADGPVTCILCKRAFSRDQLIDANQENVAANLDELKDEVMKDVQKDLTDMFKKTFGNNSNFRIK